MTLKKRETASCLPRIRVVSDSQIALGPGKVDLLEEIERSGSISQAARELGLSYRRAWTLVDTMNKSFKSYLVEGSAGGGKGGGSHLTPLGKKITNTTKQRKKREFFWKFIYRWLSVI